MDPVKINSLELENVKRIRAVQIKPTKDGLTVIGGRNGQGKTSVLDAIAWALGGNKMKPNNPNRDGAAMPAKLHVELSNGIVVERRGKNGTLYVTDSTGMKGTQKLLDEFLSQLALDLPKFLGGSDKDRSTALLQTLGIDEQLAALDGQIRSAYQQRTAIGTDARRLRAHADKLPSHDDVPDEPVSVAETYPEIDEFLKMLRNPPCELIVVTREMNMGLPSDSIEVRRYRDVVGRMNQRIAQLSSSVWLCVSGLPLKLK